MISNNYVDTKCTIWTRAYFTDDTDMDKIIQQIKEGTTNSIYDENKGFIECETLYDTELHIAPKDNYGDATVEVYRGEEVIWENSIKQ
jgi:hypothetical protein